MQNQSFLMQIATSSDSFTSNTRGSCTRRKKITKNNTPDSAQKVSQIQSEFSPKMGQTSPHLRHLVVVLQNSSFLIQKSSFLIQNFSFLIQKFMIFLTWRARPYILDRNIPRRSPAINHSRSKILFEIDQSPACIYKADSLTHTFSGLPIVVDKTSDDCCTNNHFSVFRIFIFSYILLRYFNMTVKESF